MIKLNSVKSCTVFLDFDNTITTRDVLDDIVSQFSKDDKWIDLERKWKDGKIGSKECLKGQISGIRVGKRTLDRYLAAVKIDPYFGRLKRFLDSRKFKTMIVSDNFDYILQKILRKNDIGGMTVYSNRLKMVEGRLVPDFPFDNKKCGDCAHCKKSTLLANKKKDSVTLYIGDGLSDACASREADIVFAKGYLMDYFTERKLPHVPFKELKDVYDYLKRSMT